MEATETTEVTEKITAESIQQRLSLQISPELKSLTNADLEKRRQSLATLPLLQAKPGLVGKTEEVGLGWIQTDKIIFQDIKREGGWSNEIDARKGRIAQAAGEIIKNGSDNIEHVFHPEKEGEQIKVTEIMCPAGPTYVVDDGTHRISAAKLVGLKEIPCDVKKWSTQFNKRLQMNRSLTWKEKSSLG